MDKIKMDKNKIKLCKEFGLIRVIFPERYENSFTIYSDQYLMSPNMVIIIIKSNFTNKIFRLASLRLKILIQKTCHF